MDPAFRMQVFHQVIDQYVAAMFLDSWKTLNRTREKQKLPLLPSFPGTYLGKVVLLVLQL